MIPLLSLLASAFLIFLAWPREVSTKKPADNAYRAPPPPWHAQHKKGCPARAGYDRQAKPRVRVCGCCGKSIKHPTPKPPRKG